MPVPGAFTCTYELRARGAVTATGRLRLESMPAVDDDLPLNGRLVRVHEVGLREGEPFLALVERE